MQYQILRGDCLTRMRDLADNSVDSIVTDPPYELGFMGKAWDASGIANNVEMWREALRVLRPGGHLLAFSGSRTYHRMACAIEDAGFEVRDQIQWIYGSGFPKSNNVSKAIDKAAGAVREVLTEGKAVKRMIPGADQDATGSWIKDNGREYVPQVTRAATPEARQWEGWGTALKPAHEPICVARKPLIGTVAANVLQHGTGALNIDGCRVAGESTRRHTNHTMRGGNFENHVPSERIECGSDAGRWPANLIHDGSPEVVGLFPVTTSGGGPKPGTPRSQVNTYGDPTVSMSESYGSNTGSAARFFYCAKASRADRNEGMPDPGAQFKHGTTLRQVENTGTAGNTHPTVKPTALMAYLVRLVTPPGGLVLDPFAGSGSTGKAAMREGFRFIGCELSDEYADIAEARIEHELCGGLL